jgi:hypothetical protein
MENDYLFSNHVSYRLLWCLNQKVLCGSFVWSCLFLDRVWLGEASKLAAAAGGEVQKHTKFMLVRTCRMAIYPLGYMMGTTGWYNGLIPAGNIDVAYNIADAINKIDWISNLYL